MKVSFGHYIDSFDLERTIDVNCCRCKLENVDFVYIVWSIAVTWVKFSIAVTGSEGFDLWNSYENKIKTEAVEENINLAFIHILYFAILVSPVSLGPPIRKAKILSLHFKSCPNPKTGK